MRAGARGESAAGARVERAACRGRGARGERGVSGPIIVWCAVRRYVERSERYRVCAVWDCVGLCGDWRSLLSGGCKPKTYVTMTL
eukprot:1649677-Prymnesium_polylepis.1